MVSGVNSAVKPMRWILVLLLIVTAVVVSTAIRVELLNAEMGGYLPRPQPPSIEGNDIPWRLTSSRMIEENYKRSLLAERGIEISDDAIASMELNASERDELEEMKQWNSASAKLKHLLEGMGIWQYLLVPLGVVFCVLLLMGQREASIRWLEVCCLVLLIGAGILMLYRQYYPAIAA